MFADMNFAETAIDMTNRDKKAASNGKSSPNNVSTTTSSPPLATTSKLPSLTSTASSAASSSTMMHLAAAAAAAAVASTSTNGVNADSKVVYKVKRFLCTLVQFGNDINPETGDKVKDLVFNLVVSIEI